MHAASKTPAPIHLRHFGRPAGVPGRDLVVRCAAPHRRRCAPSPSTPPTRRTRSSAICRAASTVRRTGAAREAGLAGLGACRRGVTCDALIISGHFDDGTEFYTDRFDDHEFLTVHEMQQASCSASCNGLFSQLKEVYLFGCNTLKSDPRHVASAEIARSLVRSGHTQADAERVSALLSERYGQSNRDRLRHVFKDVPVLYGFSSKAPLGRTAGPLLERYFQTAPAGEVASGRAESDPAETLRAELDDRRRRPDRCGSARGLPPRHVQLRGRSALGCTEARLHAPGAAARRDRSAHVPRTSRALRRLDRPGAAACARGGRGARRDRSATAARATATSSLHATPTKPRCRPA